jgi:hypothetical protein
MAVPSSPIHTLLLWKAWISNTSLKQDHLYDTLCQSLSPDIISTVVDGGSGNAVFISWELMTLLQTTWISRLEVTFESLF